MAEVKFKKPCNDCPFRRKSQPGWLGGHGPDWFIESALADAAVYSPGDTGVDGKPYGSGLAPCHETVDYTDEFWVENQLDDAAACAGALIFAKNLCKAPRNPVRAAAVEQMEIDRETVFATPDEFKAHHEDHPLSMRSWEKKP